MIKNILIYEVSKISYNDSGFVTKWKRHKQEDSLKLYGTQKRNALQRNN